MAEPVSCTCKEFADQKMCKHLTPALEYIKTHGDLPAVIELAGNLYIQVRLKEEP